MMYSKNDMRKVKPYFANCPGISGRLEEKGRVGMSVRCPHHMPVKYRSDVGQMWPLSG